MYAVLPYSALGGRDQPVLAAPNVRYMLPALALCAVLFAAVLPRLGRLRHVVELAAVLAIANGLRHGLLIKEGRLAAGLVAVLMLGVAVLIARRAHPPRRVVAAGLAACALAVVAAGFVRQRDFYDTRYRGADAALDLLAKAPDGTRVGLAGFESRTLPHILPAFGERLGSVVEYVGEDYRGQLRAYEQPARFDAALARGNFDYLLVARGRYAVPCNLPGEDADPATWAAAAGWKRVTLSPALALYRRP
jgi:hypothetical protein